MIDVTQKARGRQATKYEFEIIPYFVGKKLPFSSSAKQLTQPMWSIRQKPSKPKSHE